MSLTPCLVDSLIQLLMLMLGLGVLCSHKPNLIKLYLSDDFEEGHQCKKVAGGIQNEVRVYCLVHLTNPDLQVCPIDDEDILQLSLSWWGELTDLLHHRALGV